MEVAWYSEKILMQIKEKGSETLYEGVTLVRYIFQSMCCHVMKD